MSMEGEEEEEEGRSDRSKLCSLHTTVSQGGGGLPLAASVANRRAENMDVVLVSLAEAVSTAQPVPETACGIPQPSHLTTLSHLTELHAERLGGANVEVVHIRTKRVAGDISEQTQSPHKKQKLGADDSERTPVPHRVHTVGIVSCYVLSTHAEDTGVKSNNAMRMY
jgi:hypothetical protein